MAEQQWLLLAGTSGPAAANTQAVSSQGPAVPLVALTSIFLVRAYSLQAELLQATL